MSLLLLLPHIPILLKNSNLIKKTSKQNITRDIEIKSKLTVTREEGVEDNGTKKRKGCHKKDPWTKPKGGRIEGGRRGWVGLWGVVVGEMETTVLEQQ